MTIPTTVATTGAADSMKQYHDGVTMLNQQPGNNSQQSTACTSSDKKSPQNGLFDNVNNNIEKKMGQIVFKNTGDKSI